MLQYEKTDALGPLDEDDSDGEDDEEIDEENDDEYAEEETEGEESDGEYVASDDAGDDDENYRSFNDTANNTGNDTFQSSRNFSSFTATLDGSQLNNFSLNNLNDSNHNNSVAFVGEEARPNTVETFCNTTVPTLAMFNALEENDKVLAFKTFLHVSISVGRPIIFRIDLLQLKIICSPTEHSQRRLSRVSGFRYPEGVSHFERIE